MIVSRYIVKETVPQFLFTLVVFCSLIAISQLVRLSEILLAFGLTAENILLPFVYITVPFLPILIPISLLLGLMVTFAKMSEEGELIALFAFGYSLRRILQPLSWVILSVYLVTFYCSVELEAWGRREFVQFIYQKTQMEIDSLIRYKTQPGVFVQDFLGYVFYAEKIAPDHTHYENVFITPKKGSSERYFAMIAPQAEITGSVETGDLRMRLYNGFAYSPSVQTNGITTMRYTKADIDLLRIFQEQILGSEEQKDDYRSLPFRELRATVKMLSHDPLEVEVYRKARYLYLSRLANPFLLIALALFGLLLGIQEQRRSNGFSYLAAVCTIIGSFILVVGCRWYGEKGLLPISLAVWMPPLILLTFSVFLVYQKNRLPLSEPLLAWRNRPWFFGGGFAKDSSTSSAKS